MKFTEEQLSEIESLVDDINAYFRKENFTELHNSAQWLADLTDYH